MNWSGLVLPEEEVVAGAPPEDDFRAAIMGVANSKRDEIIRNAIFVIVV